MSTSTAQVGPTVDTEADQAPDVAARPMTYMEIFGGKNVVVRTVTYHYTGRLVGTVEGGGLVLADAAWVADSGRWAKALYTGDLDEVEPFPAGPVVVSAVVDVTEWAHELPRKTR